MVIKKYDKQMANPEIVDHETKRMLDILNQIELKESLIIKV